MFDVSDLFLALLKTRLDNYNCWIRSDLQCLYFKRETFIWNSFDFILKG